MRPNTYDPEADAAYVSLGETAIVDSDEIAPGVVVDYDADGRIVGFELLSVSRVVAPGGWKNWPLPGSADQAHVA